MRANTLAVTQYDRSQAVIDGLTSVNAAFHVCNKLCLLADRSFLDHFSDYFCRRRTVFYALKEVVFSFGDESKININQK